MRKFIDIVESFDPYDDPFDESQKAMLPQAVIERAVEMYAKVHNNCQLVGETSMVEGYHIESHTIGCRAAADEIKDHHWDSHWAIYDEYTHDGRSIVAGDPADGVFITITPSHAREDE